jgi:hypothetical protein
MMMQLRDHDQECEHGNKLSHAAPTEKEPRYWWCPGGAEVKGPQFVAALPGSLQIVGKGGRGHSSGIALTKGMRYQVIEIDSIDLDPTWTREIEEGIAALGLAKTIDDAVTAEVTRQMREWAPDERAIEIVVRRLIEGRTIQLTPRSPR